MKLCEHGNYHCQTCEIRMLGYVIEEQKAELSRYRELNKMFKYAVEHTKDFAEFYNYMADIAYGKAFDDVRKR